MPDNQLDDFRAITDAEGMWFGPFDRDDLFRLIRLETEEGLRRHDAPGGTVCAAHFDLHRDAEVNFNDTCFRERVMAFRADVPDPPAVH